LGDIEPLLMVTDPPYGVNYVAHFMGATVSDAAGC
jgi:hypothetical protein